MSVIENEMEETIKRFEEEGMKVTGVSETDRRPCVIIDNKCHDEEKEKEVYNFLLKYGKAIKF